MEVKTTFKLSRQSPEGKQNLIGVNGSYDKTFNLTIDHFNLLIEKPTHLFPYCGDELRNPVWLLAVKIIQRWFWKLKDKRKAVEH